jgi:hypothetical protein
LGWPTPGVFGAEALGCGTSAVVGVATTGEVTMGAPVAVKTVPVVALAAGEGVVSGVLASAAIFASSAFISRISRFHFCQSVSFDVSMEMGVEIFSSPTYMHWPSAISMVFVRSFT